MMKNAEKEQFVKEWMTKQELGTLKLAFCEELGVSRIWKYIYYKQIGQRNIFLI